MEVTKRNFAELYPSVKDAINECDFIAIDTELTGLSTQVTEHSFDTISERYSKLRENCMKFIIVQYGLSTFKYHPKQNKYTHKDFTFYVFPRPHIRQAPDPKFMCQTSSLHFLASQGFDFNKVIYDGIQYLSPAQEVKIKDFLDGKHKNEQDTFKASKNGARANGQNEVSVPEEHRKFIAEIHERVESFLCNDEQKTIHLDPCSAYQRKLIYESVQQKHQSGIEMSSVMNEKNERVIAIVKSTDEEKYERLHLKQENDLDDLDTAIGFRKVLDLISESKKLVVGHNMMLDMMHTLDQFFHPLPEKLDEFKEMLHMTFPQIMDTKLLASSEKLQHFFESTQLGKLVKQLHGKAFDLPNIEASDGFKGYDLSADKHHEAGFDAFLTGLSYIGLTTKLASVQNLPTRYSETNSKLLSPYINRIFIMKHYDTHSLNLSAPDPEPERDNVFFVSFPPEWKTIDLVELFLPYGGIYVNWLDDVSALIALKNKENIITAKANLLNKTSRVYTVRSFSDYQRAMNRQNVAKKSIDVKKTQTTVMNSDSSSTGKRRASGSAESMELIPEADENEAERADDSVSTSHESKGSSIKSKASSSGAAPSSKRPKRYHDENEAEVSSTAKVFDEENTW
jgi:poly(A)-specific ribonuclease